MERLSEVKLILDSVHGQIKIPKEWCEKIVDTPYFQRLRRIEQNSCRSVFPSARHDRFIHSLGVYHIGTLIATHLANECLVLPANQESILETYRLACLLHDVGHTPFSHTFEIFFNEKNIRTALSELLNDDSFTSDLGARAEKLTEHELLSAYVAVSKFQKKFELGRKIDWSLLVRMIIGLPYMDANDHRDSSRFENIMIELIHGTIDADGLDYVCRDAWAGGYHNFSIDLKRLIDAIRITKEGNTYHLAFYAKALNEIEGVLNVKNFQFLYVLNHHKVHLEQYYLVEAMKTSAVYHMNIADRQLALESLCNFEAYFSPIVLPKTQYKLFRPCDDDFVALMKQTQDNNDIYIKGWFERKFLHKPLWKSKMHFFHYFSDILYDIKIPIDVQKRNETDAYLKEVREHRVKAICEQSCKRHVMESLGLNDTDIAQISIKPKIRKIDNEIFISLGDRVRKLSELSHDSFTVIGEMTEFCYWYVNLDKINGNNNDEKRMKIISEIKQFVQNI